jgi:hypothetical protein
LLNHRGTDIRTTPTEQGETVTDFVGFNGKTGGTSGPR